MQSLLILLFVILTMTLITVGPGRADLPTLSTNLDASRTITWRFNNSQGLTLQGVGLSDGRAVLPWDPANVSWDNATGFLQNGTLDSHLSASAGTIVLRADSSNHVSDGDFSMIGFWNYTSSPGGNVTASRDPALQDALVQHDSPAVTQSSWDNMDSIGVNWTWTATPNVFGGIVQNNSGQKQGTGMMGMQVTMSPGAYLYGAAERKSAVDWSAHDRLVLWIKTLNVTSPLAFNVTATVGGQFRTTAARPLISGWQETVANLSQLGTSSERSALRNVMLRVNGQNVPTTWVWFDDLRFSDAKNFDEGATVSQVFSKVAVTNPQPGSATLYFRWAMQNASGIAGYSASVNLSGGTKPYEANLVGSVGSWHSFLEDVSADTGPSGVYNLSLRLQVRVDNITASNATLRVDDVSLVFPNRQNGTYLSAPISFGSKSELLNVTWSASLAAATSAWFSLRTGNDSNPGSAGWSSWSSWGTPGRSALSLPGNLYFQVRVDLGTTNASLTPIMQSFRLETRHRLAQGTIISAVFTAPTDVSFLRWRSFNATWNDTPSVSIAFSIGDGFFFNAVAAGQRITMVGGTSIQWMAKLTTSNGLETPSLLTVAVVYEYLGPITHVSVTTPSSAQVTAGKMIQFYATALDVGNHTVPSAVFTWTTDDPAGHVYPNGTYVSGRPGNWSVVATVQGLAVSGFARVNVSAASPTQSTPYDTWPYWSYVLGIIAAAVVGFSAYEVWIRRIFAIDDVFLISKDGRLIMHNTRRMRADRDEDILSGMLTAIVAFIKDSDPEENGELRRFEVGGKTTLLERGNHVFLTSIYSGRVPGWAPKDLRRFVRDLERTFGPAFAKWNGSPEDLQGVKEFMDHFVSRIRYRGPPS
ncbi:MAG: hypothetical protein AABX97_08865 [Candidatus Thermoplasmatota archaeon]